VEANVRKNIQSIQAAPTIEHHHGKCHDAKEYQAQRETFFSETELHIYCQPQLYKKEYPRLQPICY